MSDSPVTAAARPAALRWTTRFAAATWAASAGLVLIFALFWRMFYAPPHAFWAVATTGTVLLAGVLTILAGIYQLIRGPKRVLTGAVILLGTTPIVCLAMFFLSLYLKAGYRQPIRFSASTRIVLFWAESVGDLEARWRYPRWTLGRHVMLYDDSQTLPPAQLVAQMDDYIEQISAHLRVPVPSGTARWVRGPLLGKHGIALMSWAVCDVGEPVGELTSFDRHEVAHVVMAMMGNADQDPPMLLAEGWAESQSKDREDLILRLAQELEQGTNYSLQELVGPDWYGRSVGPVYHHGGPLVVYLMEHYGPEEFFRFYHGVRPATFPADCQRILGDPWPEVERQFWEWLVAEAAKLNAARGTTEPPPSQTSDNVELAESVDPKHWQAIVAGYRAARPERPPIPDPCAFAVDRTDTVPRTDSGSRPGTYRETWQTVIDGDKAWQLHSIQPQGTEEATLEKADSSAIYRVSAGGHVARMDMHGYSSAARDGVRENWDQFASFADLGYYLPVEPKSHFRGVISINAIRPPATPAESLWEIDYVQRLPDGAGEITYHLRIDASADWLVESYRNASANERTECRNTLGTLFAHAAAIESTACTETDQGAWTMQLRLRELNSLEAQQVRNEVEAIARRGPTRDWRELLLRPLTLAIAWPAIGLMLLGLALVRNDRKIGEPEED